MQGDIVIDHQQAEAIQQESQQQGMLAIWVVFWNTADYPDRAVVRLQGADGEGVHIFSYVLIGDSLDAVRDLLPYGLTRLERHPDDDLNIIETWI